MESPMVCLDCGRNDGWTVWLNCYSEPTIASPDLRPHLGIDRQSTHTPGFGVEKGSVIVQLSIAEEPRQHSQCARRQGLVDEWLLSIESFDRRAARQSVFARRRINDLGIQLTDSAQPDSSAPFRELSGCPRMYCPARSVKV